MVEDSPIVLSALCVQGESVTEGCAHCARREAEQEPLDLAPINRALKDTVSGFAYRRHVRGEKNPRIYKDDMRLLISEIERLRAESVATLAAISRQVEALEAQLATAELVAERSIAAEVAATQREIDLRAQVASLAAENVALIHEKDALLLEIKALESQAGA